MGESLSENNGVYPSVDVIMPTLNSERTLEASLNSIKKQKYSGNINIILIDGGSSDKTLKIASRYGVFILEEKGKYMHGSNGAYNIGIKRSNAPLILRMDSDNVLVEDTFIQKMIAPLVQDHSINLSVSLSTYAENSTCYEKYGSIIDQCQLRDIASRGSNRGEYSVVDDLTLGLTNCVIFKRKDYNKIGKFVSDVGYLVALRANGLSKAAINLNCHYIHYSTPSYKSHLKKMSNRVKRVAKEANNLKIDYRYSDITMKNQGLSIKSYIRAVLVTGMKLIKYRNRIYVCGTLMAIAPLIAMLLHPFSAAKMYFGHFKKLQKEAG